MLQILIRIVEHFVVFVQIVDQIFDKVEIVSVKRAQLYLVEILASRLSLLLLPGFVDQI